MWNGGSERRGEAAMEQEMRGRVGDGTGDEERIGVEEKYPEKKTKER